MRWWQWVLLGTGLWLIALAFIITFLKGAHWEDGE